MLIALSVALLIFIADYYAYPWWQPIRAPIADKGQNGLWVRYKFYFGEHTDDEIDALAHRIVDGRFSDAYIHVRFIKKDGSLAYRYPERAKHLLSRLRESAPGTRMIAWVYAGNESGGGEVDLTDRRVRKKMVDEAVWLVDVCGFDGVQWDYETCPDGDTNLLKLLTETRTALPTGARLSVCAPVIYPLGLRFGWSQGYVSKIAQYVDQVAVMCYDTGYLTPRSYVALTRKQVVWFTQLVSKASKHANVVIGVPTYGQGLRSHNPRAENLRNALRGVREGLARDDAVKDAFAGVAVFADYTTTEDEWKTYRALWLGD